MNSLQNLAVWTFRVCLQVTNESHRVQVIPPGMDFSNVHVQDVDGMENDVDNAISETFDGTLDTSLGENPPIWDEVSST